MAGGAGGLLGAVRKGRGRLIKEAPAMAPWTANGHMPPMTPKVLAPLRPKMRWRLPKGMAALLVYRQGESERFELLGAYGHKQVEPLGGARKPGFDFNSLAVQLEQTVVICLEMASWSREKRELVDWLNRARTDAERDSTDLELVVWDDTGFHIPWELFWLPDPLTPRPPSFLGALVTVSRWLTVTRSDIVHDFTKDLGQATGPVAAYVYEGAKPGDGMGRDKQLLMDLRVEYADSMWDLLTSLRDLHREALAMVYAACHGEFGDEPGASRLGGLLLESASMLGDAGFGRLHNRKTLVFLNACASGPVGEDRGRYNDGALRGFPKMFMETGAAGVLATAAPIKDDFAHEAARDLLELLRLNPRLPVARAVRDLRRIAADRLPDDIWRTGIPARQQEAANETLLPILYWFMYLYYGSPRMAISFASGDTPLASS
jgi:hypothetical protein